MRAANVRPDTCGIFPGCDGERVFRGLRVLERLNNANAVLSPFVYYVGTEQPALSPQESEVAAAHWIALDYLLRAKEPVVHPAGL